MVAVKARERGDDMTMRRTVRDPGAISGLLTGIAFVAAIVGAMRIAKNPFPRPGSPADDIRTYYRESAPAARWSVAMQLVSVLSLARFTRSVARLAERGNEPKIIPAAVTASGEAAAALLAASAATHASLTVPRDIDDETLVRTSQRVFAAGGPIHGVAYGIFTALLAKVGRDTGQLSKPLATTGYVSAAASVLSPAYFKWENAGWLIPIGRFTGYVVSGALGVRLAARGA
jgi:hypothetical protein